MATRFVLRPPSPPAVAPAPVVIPGPPVPVIPEAVPAVAPPPLLDDLIQVQGAPKGLMMNATTIVMPSGERLERNMLSADNPSMREDIPDPMGRAGVHPDPALPYGGHFVAELAGRSRTFVSQGWYEFGMTVCGISGVRDILASGEAGGVDTITKSLIGLDDTLKAGRTLAQEQEKQTEVPLANKVAMNRDRDRDQTASTSKFNDDDRTLARALANQAVPPAPQVDISRVPPALLPALNPRLNPRTNNTDTQQEIILSHMRAGKLTKETIDAMTILFPKVDPPATSLKYNLTSLMSGFALINPIITSHAKIAAFWLKKEIVDPLTGNSPFVVTLELIEAAVLCYIHPTPFAVLVARLIQQNAPNNGAPITLHVSQNITELVDQAKTDLLYSVTNGRVTDGPRADRYVGNPKKRKRNQQRPWLFDD